MSITKTYDPIIDDGFTFSNIVAVETSVGTTDSLINDGFAGPVAAPNGLSAVPGLRWGSVGSATGPGSSLNVVMEYDVTSNSSDPAAWIRAIRQNSVTPDNVIPAGARLTIVEEIFTSKGGTLIGVSTLDTQTGPRDLQDPPLEAGADTQLSTVYQSVFVRVTLSVTIDSTAAAGTTLSLSSMQQAFGTPASIGDYVFEDKNTNGIQDGNDTPIAGVTVELLDANNSVVATDVTDNNGNYRFDGLLPIGADGNPIQYKVRFITPDGYTPTTANVGNDAADSDAVNGVTQTITLGYGQYNGTLDAGFFKPVVIPNAALGDKVWLDKDADGIQDDDENGVANVTVELLDATGTTVIDTDVTDGAGEYLFSGLAAGTYRVRFDLSAYQQTLTDQGGDDSKDSDAGAGGLTGPYTLADGETNLTVDAGVYQRAALGDRVWLDKNANGIQDGGENGIQGVTVELLSADGLTVIDTEVTNITGNYLFTALTPGDYKVRFVQPAGYEPTLPNVGNDADDSDAVGGVTDIYNLSSGETDLTADAGFYQLAGLGDYVWEDKDADGVQDGDESPISGVTVQLLDGNGNQVGETTTNGAGYYEFTGLVPGDYSVKFLTPAGYKPTVANVGNDADDSDAVGGVTQEVTLTSNEFNGTLDAGFFRPAELGDYVWEDKDADGVQDGDEQGIGGVTVNLLSADGATVLDTEVTDANGKYLFTDLDPGSYKVAFQTPGGGYIPTTADVGNDADDSDAVGGVTGVYTLESGDSDLTVDAGFYRLAGLGDYVWLDTNGNGLQDDGATGVGGVTVLLLDSTGTPTGASTTTAPDGSYSFTGLIPGTYSVQFVAPAGYAFTSKDSGGDAQDSDADLLTGKTASVTLTSNEFNGTLDAGLVRAGAEIQVVKTTSGNANLVGSDGITLLAGSDVFWTYAVTNTGPVDLTNIVLTDDQGEIPVLVNNGDGDAILEVGETWIYKASDPDAVLGPYSNTATVTGDFTDGLGQTTKVQDDDPSNYVGVKPDVDIEKYVSVDGGATFFDADTATGPLLLQGGTPIFKFVVTNTGGVALTNLLVDDDKLDLNGGLAGDTITISSLAVGGVYEFTVDGPWEAGQHVNTATVAGTFTDDWGNSANVGDSDKAHYVGIEDKTPTIDVVKTTSGNANLVGTDGITLLAGSDVYWTYAVTNTGPVDLSNIVLTDDQGEIPVLVNNGDGDALLEVGETWIYKASGTAVLGNYVNEASVTGTYTPPVGPTKQATDKDPSNYVGVKPDVDIEKYVSVDGGATFFDADTPTGPLLQQGGTPIFKFVVTNTGGVALTNLAVDDNLIDLNGALAGTSIIIPSLAVGGVYEFQVSDEWQAGQHTNTATVVAVYTDDWGNSEQVDDADDANYFGQVTTTPGIDIEKTTSGSSNSNTTAADYDNEDAANGAGVPVLVVGSDVKWTYKVTNTGNTVFTKNEISIVDDNGTTNTTADDMTTANGQIVLKTKTGGDQDDLLEAGEVWFYEATGTVKNLTTTTGVTTTFDFSGNSALDGTDGNVRSFTSDGVSVKASAWSRTDSGGTWSKAWLGSFGGGLGVTDSGEGNGSGDAHTVDNMGGRDNYVMFRFDQQVILDKAYLGYVVCDSDMTVWIGTLPDAFNTDIALTDSVLAGLGFKEYNDTTSTSARWADLNAGNVSGNVIVIAARDDDTSPEDRFKIEHLKVKTISQDGVYENEATVTAQGATDSDLSHYKTTPATPKIDIEKTTSGSSNSNTTAADYDNEDAANGAGVPVLVVGSDVKWTYKVVNTGNTVFAKNEISIVDDNGTTNTTADDMTTANGQIVLKTKTGGDQDDLLETGETWFYEATGVVKNLTTVGASTTFDFSGSSAVDGTDGNVRSFTSGGINVKASAWSRTDGTNGTWANGYLGSFGGGLGVTDRSESGSGDTHTVDNMGGRDNYVLFRFDQQVVVDAAYLGYVVCDSDVSVWIGTISDAFNASITLSDSVLSGLGFKEVNDTTLGTARWADFNNGNLAGNVLVIASSDMDTTPDDAFKIEYLKVKTVSQSGTYENKATVTAQGATDSDLSHYKNVVAKPGIDIEKTTSGSSNSNPTAATYDNEDTASGAGVPVLVAGSDVKWTYKVVNTGNTVFTKSEISIVDDNGTTSSTSDDMTTANGRIVLKTKSGGDQDDLLETGETWFYEATGTVKNLSTPGTAVTFDFSGNSALDGTDGNVRSYSAGGVNVKASAWSNTSGTTGTWANGFLGAFGGGLGVTDRAEGDGSGNSHTVDNSGRENFVLFRFDQQVVLDKAYLGYVVCDSDMSVWIGTINGAFGNNSFALNGTELAKLGFTEVNNGGSSARWADLNAGNVAGNVVVIAARTDQSDDYFKLEKLLLNTAPNVGVYGNTAVVTAQGATDSDMSFYTNPEIRIGQPDLWC